MSSSCDRKTSPHVIRDVRTRDIDDIFELSTLLNTINLPANRQELELVIANSEKSFSLQEKDSTKRSFLFVITDQQDRVIGTSQIFAKHGTLNSPHLYFQVGYEERYSETLRKYFRHRTLRLCQSFDGPTEIGSLVLAPKFRASKEKLGQNLSYVRFLFMAMQPDFFSHKVLAELLPPLGENLESALWDAVGRKFTGLDYYEADIISRKNKEFIKTLFPTGEIYVTLLPDNAQDIIGQVGQKSKGAAHLLSKIGFSYSHRVDPFDGGPHFEADQEDISLIEKTFHGRASCITKTEGLGQGLCGRFSPKEKSGDRFRAVFSHYRSERTSGHIGLPPPVLELLGIKEDDRVSAMDVG